MWIFTPTAALSIVQMQGQEDKLLMVRSRRREHLENFGYSEDEIIETPDNDYQFRVISSYEIVMKKVMSTVGKIDYGNFKDRAKNEGHLPVDMLANIWQTTFNHLDQRIF